MTLPEITDADREIARMAYPAATESGWMFDSMCKAAALSRIRATTPQVDPDLLAVREIVATTNRLDGRNLWAEEARRGEHDGHVEMKSALAAYNAGKAVGRE